MKSPKNLSRREREIMDIIYALDGATALQVLERLPVPPSYSAVRALLRILERKGHLTHHREGPRYVFSPVLPREKARKSALRHLVKTFFDDSAEDVVAALLDISEAGLTEDEFRRLLELVNRARREGR
ncbi:MAG TPA: BlaI/MecI/CopY family transcriptional regulator [Candidatus Aminicenantes bacterium]|nr:BlaI/MecI/CopY family transcriptional regulator [Candidatus Aminicenantes bacterium]